MEKREIVITNPKLEEIFQKRTEIKDAISLIVDNIDKQQEELNKLGIKMQKQKERAVVEVKKLNLNLTEFEEINTFDTIDGKLTVIITDRLEEFKEKFREAKNPKTESPN